MANCLYNGCNIPIELTLDQLLIYVKLLTYSISYYKIKVNLLVVINYIFIVPIELEKFKKYKGLSKYKKLDSWIKFIESPEVVDMSNKEIVKAIEIYLGKENYEIIKAYDGEQALKEIKKNEIQLIILDVMMPKKDGIETLEEIRRDKNIPVIMLSAKSEDIDKINGLNIGADDYVTKPFNPIELIARINALIRRYTKLGSSINESASKSETSNINIIQDGELIINDELKQVIVDGKEVKLTPTEYNILKFLTKNKGKVFSIEDIYTNVWDGECYAAENVIAVHIRHIREKIEINPKEPKYLKVIWGIGYKVEAL